MPEQAINDKQATQAQAQKGPNGKFLPGNTMGTGRPKMDPEIKAMLKAATPKAVQVLIDTLNGKNAVLKFKAAREILDRSLGKPEVMSRLELSSADNRGFVFTWRKEED